MLKNLLMKNNIQKRFNNNNRLEYIYQNRNHFL